LQINKNNFNSIPYFKRRLRHNNGLFAYQVPHQPHYHFIKASKIFVFLSIRKQKRKTKERKSCYYVHMFYVGLQE